MTCETRGAEVIPLRDKRTRPVPPDLRARWFSPDDFLCLSDQDCPPDRLCMGGHCV
ncbi:hypothetical protein ABT120_55555 [Nonomuraea angiospora]|uniref:hypothetical protein n=1 Tax=Nonomuraea angiospora TaxID=46172 RepID=UPI00332A9AA7